MKGKEKGKERKGKERKRRIAETAGQKIAHDEKRKGKGAASLRI
jgi:hypothetical protein